jgi:hypothetical protein
MRRIEENSSCRASGRVRLVGGPPEFTGSVDLGELGEVFRSDEKIKIRHRNGYEHYESVGGPSSVDFRWVGTTKIAE